MKPRDYFGVAIRVLGVWQILAGIAELVTCANVMMKLFEAVHTSPFAYLTHGLVQLLFGGMLLFSAQGLVDAVYPVSMDANVSPANAKPGEERDQTEGHT